MLVAFTAPYATREFNANRSMYAWEVSRDSGAATTTLVVPRAAGDASEGGYRMIPWDSIAGEGIDEPAL